MVRIALVAAVTLAAWAGLGVRLAYLHLGENTHLRDRVENIRRIEKEILVGRGRIFDRNENLMAMDLSVKHVFVDPVRIQENGYGGFIANQLGRLLNLSPATIASKIERTGRRHEYVAKYIPEDKAREIDQLGFNGVHFEDVSARYYPRGSLMSHVLGFSNLEGVGSAGVELRYDRYLRGVPGLRITEVDGHRREVYLRRGVDIRPQEGADVHLTLDQHIQYFTERTLDKTMEEHNALGAWAIVQEIKTGRILAMASRPAFDPNEFRYSQPEERRNRTIAYTYEPGSTFKVAIIAAVLNEHLVNPGDLIDCENGMWLYNRRPLRDYHAYGKLTVADVLKKSSNIGTAKLAMMLGEERVYEYLRNFGFGTAADLELPGEEAGILHPTRNWSAISLSRIAMGHEVAVTALQMVNMLSAIGNNGFLMKPRIIDRIVNAEGEEIYRSEAEALSRPIRGETARLMCKMLTRVTEEGGTGRKAKIDGYTVGGKTGTAQKPKDGSYSDSANIASFMGLVPAEDPQIAVIVVVDEPQPLHTGGAVAAPAFRDIAEQSLRYLDIPPVPAELAYHFGDEVPEF